MKNKQDGLKLCRVHRSGKTQTTWLNYSDSCSLFFFLICFAVLSPTAFSQQKETSQIEIVSAKEVTGYSNTQTNKLVGNVVCKQGNVFLYCDSAFLHDAQNTMDAYGNVHMVQGDTINLYGDKLLYNGNTKIADVYENVKLTDRSMTLTTKHLTYDLSNDVGFYTEFSRIVNKENILVSEKGYYYSKTKEFFFKDDVSLTNPNYIMNSDTLRYNTVSRTAFFFGPTTIRSKENLIYCEKGWYNTVNETSSFTSHSYLLSKNQKLIGDSLFYNRNKGVGEAFRNVELLDTAQKLTITGNYGITHRSNDLSFVTGRALLIRQFEKDSLFLHGDTLKTTFDTIAKERKLYAFHHVRIFKTDLRGKCDSMAYSSKDSLLRMFNAPVMWSDSNQMTAEYINLKLSNNKIDKLYLINGSFITSREDSIRYNQIKGRNMIGYFTDSKLTKIKVTGNGQTVYYGRDKNKELMGVNKADCSDIMIYIKENKIDRISLLTHPDATFFPIDKIRPRELMLRGFTWLEEKKPLSKEDVFNWK